MQKSTDKLIRIVLKLDKTMKELQHNNPGELAKRLKSINLDDITPSKRERLLDIISRMNLNITE